MSEIGRMLKDNAGIRFVDSYTLAAILENVGVCATAPRPKYTDRTSAFRAKSYD
jgi:hypothetical protein